MFRIEGSNGKYDGDYSTKEAAIKAIEIWQKSYPCIKFKVLDIDNEKQANSMFWMNARREGIIL